MLHTYGAMSAAYISQIIPRAEKAHAANILPEQL